MELNSLPKIVARRKKALGRGLGSGKGKTAGRGQKGQKARGKVPLANVGAGLFFYKKFPFKRGWGNKKVSVKPTTITLEKLNSLKPKTAVNLETLIENRLVSAKAARNGVKILTGGELKVALSIQLPVSESVKRAVEKAGGQVVG
jgi:large subunit ribosomal protein L15